MRKAAAPEGTPSRYVQTKAAQLAVKGHEVEIVRAVGIPWEAGQRDHIDCPYPHHGGAKDWRLNSRGRAICSCTEGRTDSVFDIVAKVENLEFEEAKIRCVELAGRGDLIRETRIVPGRAFLSTDARSLLNAPAEGRNDELPRAYLAHRLGVAHDAVPMPSTPVVGLRTLGYYDAPKGKGGGKPVYVDDFPCAVFGQIDAKGRTHAHRIYLAPGGRGKVDLGTTADGRARDPKKSAKIVEEGISTAGRVVVWGDQEAAPWCVVAEGIETAAAVALAHRQEIEAREAYVVAGINAGGIEAFVPWPATKRVTVAADRDEAPKEGRPAPTRRGENAAREFGVRNHQGVRVDIALPGEAGSAFDWLNVLEKGGVDAVRSGIGAAAPYVPTEAEIRDEHERVEGYERLREITEAYPLPVLSSLSLAYERTKAGKLWVHKAVKLGNIVDMVPIASPFGVSRRLRFLGATEAFGLRIAVQDMRGEPRFIDVRRGDLARYQGSEIRVLLYNAGLRVEADGDAIVVQVLKAADPGAEVQVVAKPGWHEVEGCDPFFACPSGEIIGAPEGTDYELAKDPLRNANLAPAGTFEGWRDAVTAAVTIDGVEHWTLGACAAFAGVLVGLTSLETCGINLSGRSSGGKSTAQRIAVSAWSTPDIRKEGLALSAKTTVNAVDGKASQASGTVFSLDDLVHMSGADVAKIIYTLASGTGRQRMNAEAELRARSTWSTFAILSAECTLSEKVKGEDGGDWLAGMATRFADIDVSTINRDVDKDTLACIGGIEHHYGHAGPAFVRALIKEGTHRKGAQLRETILGRARQIAGHAADPSRIRAATSFALLCIAGEMATRFGLLPPEASIAGSLDWAWRQFIGSSDARVLSPEEQIVENLRAAIAARWGVSIRRIGDRAGARDAEGWFDTDTVYILREKLRPFSGNVLPEGATAELLNNKDLLVDSETDGRRYVRYIKGVGRVSAFALSRNEFGRENDHLDGVDAANDLIYSQRKYG